MVFAYGGVEVGAVIRSTEQYDLMKMKPTESKERYRCRLQLCQVYDPVKASWIVGVVIPCLISGCTHRAWELALGLVGSSASAWDSDNLVFTGSKALDSLAKLEESKTVLFLPTPSGLWLSLRLWFSIFIRSEVLLRLRLRPLRKPSFMQIYFSLKPTIDC